MRSRTGRFGWRGVALVVGLLAVFALPAQAQVRRLPAGRGLGARQGQSQARPAQQAPQPDLSSLLGTNEPTPPDSGVSFLDSALPVTRLRLRYDDATRHRRPTRAEFFYPVGGAAGSPGPPIPERNVNFQEYTAYLEYALDPRFSTFMEVPLRAVDPDFNENTFGVGDVNSGFKWAFLRSDVLATTFQLRTYVPTGTSHRGLGTNHVSVEPALLANVRVARWLVLEAEGRYWYPIGGTDFAGDVVRYGLGLTFGTRSPTDFWITPVVEAVGWSVLGGKALVVQTPTAFGITDAAGTTIANVALGLRFGFGGALDLYAGYSRALTGPTWYKDLWRIEFRLSF